MPSGPRIFVAVFCAILSAMGAAWCAYHFWVQVPERRARNAEAARRLFHERLEDQGYDPVTRLTADQLEEQIKSDDPDSPCDILNGLMFANCASSESRDYQRLTVDLAQHTKR